jgi:photosystem II stability/assembly factor-like uncharacterized protein
MKNSLLLLIVVSCFKINAQKQAPSQTTANNASINYESVLNALTFRSIGPAVTSGRISDIVVNPLDKSEWYLAAASGGVWKTNNAGTSFSPIFDAQASFSIGCLKMDPKNPHIIWVGTGENNNQRSVAYGDGIYKSEDGGKTWKNMGLKSSEHIGMIAIDPNNTNIVYVAAYGPLWNSGGERGIYKSTDGGTTWNIVLNVSEHTGFNEVHIDPNNPNIIYASAHQRQRHEWTYVGGGPESAVYKSTDFGVTWNKLDNGLPKGDVGRISLAISPVKSDYVYVLIEASNGNQGLYFSNDRGASFEKRSSYSSAGNYYVEIFADPVNADKIYSMNTWAEVSNDGGRTFQGIGENNKHVDNHAIWIDKENTNHILLGCDGGLYETWDKASTWDYKSNLPITQFYRVTVDNAKPFYNIYGGTQDNNTLGGPSRTISASGIHNYDWFVTVGGDGFKTVVDPKDPNIVYSQWQYGGLVRYNKKTGEAFDIKPQEIGNEPAFRFNWDAPIVLSKHDNSTLYFAAQKLFKSTDKGSSWQIISPDLSRGLDRNNLTVMGKVWSMDAVAKNQSTSIYGNITAISESPINPKLLFIGTDDGLIHITDDGGSSWFKIDNIPGVPKQTLVQNIYASKHDQNTAFVVFNNHRNGDFKPYVFKTIDKGKTWLPIQNNLPVRGSAQCIAEDHKNKDLLFLGTDFGLFSSIDGGKNWVSFKSGLPTICIKEIAIQERENDLVLATFGRGFYVLDDYTPLQNYMVQKQSLETSTASIFPIKEALVYIPSQPLGHRGKSFQGESFYTADNPTIGAVITYSVKDEYKTMKEIRQAKEEKQLNDFYPSKDSIIKENLEPSYYILAEISDSMAQAVKQYKLPVKKGVNRFIWNGRYDKTSPISFYTPDPSNPYESDDQGALAIPGLYSVKIKIMKGYNLIYTSKEQSFRLSTLFEIGNSSTKLNNDLAEVRRVILGTNQYCDVLENKLNFIKAGIPYIKDVSILKKIKELEDLLTKIRFEMNGNGIIASREFEVLPGIVGSIEGIVGNLWSTSQTPTKTFEDKLEDIRKKFTPVYTEIINLKEGIELLEVLLEQLKFPATPGRLPAWKG